MQYPNPFGALLVMDEDGRLAEDLTCMRCGYNLRSLKPHQGCPECGLAVERSVLGDSLSFADPKWLGRLTAGAWTLFVGSILNAVIGGGGSCVFSQVLHSATPSLHDGTVIFYGIGVALATVNIVGYWIVTSPEPGSDEREPTWSRRRLARWTVVSAYGAQLLSLSFAMAFADWAFYLGNTLSFLTYAAALILMLTYAIEMARRMPSATLVQQSKVVMWGLGIAMALGAIFMVFAFLLSTSLVASQPQPMAPGAAPPSPPNPVPMIGAGLAFCGYFLLTAVFGVWGIVLIGMFASRLGATARWAKQFVNEDGSMNWPPMQPGLYPYGGAPYPMAPSGYAPAQPQPPAYYQPGPTCPDGAGPAPQPSQQPAPSPRDERRPTWSDTRHPKPIDPTEVLDPGEDKPTPPPPPPPPTP